MARRFDLVVFDWDGTLMDSTLAIVRALQAASRDLGLPEPAEASARHIIGLGLGDALRVVQPSLPVHDYGRLADRYRHHYLGKDHELELFDGVADLISLLAGDGYQLAVATGKSRLGLQRALAVSGLDACFAATRCADECHSKPHPAMLLELMDELSVGPERTVMVGDTTHDLEMARNAGVAAVAVTCGAHPEAELRRFEPLACLDHTRDLVRWV